VSGESKNEEGGTTMMPENIGVRFEKERGGF